MSRDVALTLVGTAAGTILGWALGWLTSWWFFRLSGRSAEQQIDFLQGQIGERTTFIYDRLQVISLAMEDAGLIKLERTPEGVPIRNATVAAAMATAHAWGITPAVQATSSPDGPDAPATELS